MSCGSCDRVVPGADARPRLAATLDCRQVVLTAELWRVVQAIDGHRSARSLAHQLGLSQRELGRALKALVEAGLVDVDAGPAAGPSLLTGSRPPGEGQEAARRTILIRAANDRPPAPTPEPDEAAAWPSAG